MSFFVDMTRGKIYKDEKGMVVMCTKSDSSKYFEGVVVSYRKQPDIIGVYSKLFVKDNYKENIGQIDLNNVFIK